MKATIAVRPKTSILDPQGEALARALRAMGFEEVLEARVGRIVELAIKPQADEKQTQQRLEDMCRQLIANKVIEDYEIKIRPS